MSADIFAAHSLILRKSPRKLIEFVDIPWSL